MAARKEEKRRQWLGEREKQGRIHDGDVNIFQLEFAVLKKNASQTDRQTDGRTDGPTDGPTDGWTKPLIEMRGRI